ncbi:MAG: thioredoxin [Candidatus Pacearchaeota archaeon]
MIIDVNDSEFEEKVINQSKKIPVLVDFWATWCGPCMTLKPILERIARDLGESIVLAKIDVEKNQENALKYSVMSIPAVKLFKDGHIVDEFVGAQPEEIIREWLKQKL